jgi:endonuclease III
MNASLDELAGRLLDRYGRSYADEAGIRLADRPAPLFQLLVLALLLSTRISAGIAVAAAGQLFASGWTSPQRMGEAPRSGLVAALGRAGYRRYDERTATRLREISVAVREKYGGDLRRLAAAADGDVERAGELLREFTGIGPTGSAVFLREVQAVWPWVRPVLGARAVDGAARAGLPTEETSLARLVPPDDLARFAAGLVRISLLGKNERPLPDDWETAACDEVTARDDGRTPCRTTRGRRPSRPR